MMMYQGRLLTVLCWFLVCSTDAGQNVTGEAIRAKYKRSPIENEEFCKISVPNRRMLPEQDDFDKKSVEWFKFCIVDIYNFRQDETAQKATWKEAIGFPSLAGKFEDPHFKRAAEVAEEFFRDKTWLESYEQWRIDDKCLKLLYITAARYIYVTYLLYEVSKPRDVKGTPVKGKMGTLEECVKVGGKITLPKEVCYMLPYGSASCTSDYDVGLVGAKSGQIVSDFNKEFERLMGLPSEYVFDTNVYAYSLEYAMPYLFQGFAPGFVENLSIMDKAYVFQIQDLVSALFKVMKYNAHQFNELLKSKFENKAEQKQFSDWMKYVLENYKEEKGTADYSNKVAEISSLTHGNNYLTMYIQQLMLALMKASEAYHSRGAMRYVVGVLQLKNNEVKSKLTTVDLWCTFIENWGDSMKEYSLFKQKSARKALIKMSKYLSRTFQGMSKISVKRFPGACKKVDKIVAVVTEYAKMKKDGVEQIAEEQISKIQRLYDLIGCVSTADGLESLPKTCVEKLFEIVNCYHKQLTALFPDKLP